MTVDILAMGIIAFLTSVLYADQKVERSADKLRHEQNNMRVRLRRLERSAFPNENDSEEVG